MPGWRFARHNDCRIRGQIKWPLMGGLLLQLIAVLAIGLAVSGCNSPSASGATPTGTPTASPTPQAADTQTTVPSPTPTSTASPLASPTATVTSTPAYSSALQLKSDSYLLSISDLPIGWTIETGATGDREPRIIPRPGVCGEPPNPMGPLAHSDILFKEARFGPYLKQIVNIFPAGSGPQAFNEEVARWTCSEWVQMSYRAYPVTWHFHSISFPKIGDETFAVGMTTQDAPVAGVAQFDVVVFRKGDVVEVIINGGPGITPPSDILTEASAQTAVAKIK
ncbi:MAG: hypothetical protein M1319_02570 [Chloroflexi bacterium]|nr:hypothetical protein [Chloroflexota bacterium]